MKAGQDDEEPARPAERDGKLALDPPVPGFIVKEQVTLVWLHPGAHALPAARASWLGRCSDRGEAQDREPAQLALMERRGGAGVLCCAVGKGPWEDGVCLFLLSSRGLDPTAVPELTTGSQPAERLD